VGTQVTELGNSVVNPDPELFAAELEPGSGMHSGAGSGSGSDIKSNDNGSHRHSIKLSR
jgi:hypothetical protein